MFNPTSPTIRYKPSFRPRPQHVSEHWYRFPATKQESGFEAFVNEQVIDTIINDTLEWANLETIGWLLGRSFRDQRGFYAYVTKALVAPYALRQRSTVQTTPRDEKYLAQQMGNQFLHLDRIGWWHSHPNLGLLRYSGTDFANQSIWCPDAHQMALLVALDAHIVRVCGFAGPDANTLGVGAEFTLSKSMINNHRTLSEQPDNPFQQAVQQSNGLFWRVLEWLAQRSAPPFEEQPTNDPDPQRVDKQDAPFSGANKCQEPRINQQETH